MRYSISVIALAIAASWAIGSMAAAQQGGSTQQATPDPASNGRPEGSYENFVTGFWASGQHRAEVWGRPTALAVMRDGSLLIADDTGGTIWRVSYTGPKDRASGRPNTTTGTMSR
jgi:glucose/arabinose dehydrogenase